MEIICKIICNRHALHVHISDQWEWFVKGESAIKVKLIRSYKIIGKPVQYYKHTEYRHDRLVMSWFVIFMHATQIHLSRINNKITSYLPN